MKAFAGLPEHLQPSNLPRDEAKEIAHRIYAAWQADSRWSHPMRVVNAEGQQVPMEFFWAELAAKAVLK